MQELMQDVMQRVSNYLSEIQTRRVSPSPEAVAALSELDIPLPDNGLEPNEVLRLLDEIGSPATVASAGGRYFGFVTGGVLPSALAANQLAAAWDQNAGLYVGSPVAGVIEDVAEGWLVEILGLPKGTAAGFVTGATMANFTGLAAARNHLLARAGWDVQQRGLYGAPEIKVVVGEEYHASMKKALSMVGLGRERVIKVPVDDQGRILADALPEMDEMTITCLQAGNVNSGAFDPLPEIIPIAQKAGAWVHIDAAFGLWARVSPELAHLAAGIELADSIAADSHKWLNVPYDSGIIFVRDREAVVDSMAFGAAYLIESGQRENEYYTPEMSRRGRGIEVWAALLSLGKEGLAELVERNCHQARRFAEGLQEAGFEILNDVVLNQVMVKFGDAETTNKVIAAVQEEGTMWAGGTVWQGHAAMRISVSSWATTDEDVEASLEALMRVANEVMAA